MNHFEATATPADFNPADFNWGRKGVAYDWQSLFAAAEAATLDREHAALAPAGFPTATVASATCASATFASATFASAGALDAE